MPASTFTIKEMIEFSAFRSVKLADIIEKYEPIEMGRMVYNLRKALVEYTKQYKTPDEDPVKMDVIGNIAILEKYAGLKFRVYWKQQLKKQGYDDVQCKKRSRLMWIEHYNKYWRY